MNDETIREFTNLEFEIQTKYKGKIKEEFKERAMLSLEWFIIFFVFIWLTISASLDQFDVLRYEALQNAVIILLALADVIILLIAIFSPFLLRHTRGLKGKINYTIYKNDKNEIRCRCNGVKRGRNVTYDELCKEIKIQKYSIRLYYKTFKYFRIPLCQLDEKMLEQIKMLKHKYVIN